MIRPAPTTRYAGLAAQVSTHEAPWMERAAEQLAINDRQSAADDATLERCRRHLALNRRMDRWWNPLRSMLRAVTAELEVSITALEMAHAHLQRADAELRREIELRILAACAARIRGAAVRRVCAHPDREYEARP
jgi:hypothetical protein